MPKDSKLTPFEASIRGWRALSWTYSGIAKHLKSAHGIEVHRTTVESFCTIRGIEKRDLRFHPGQNPQPQNPQPQNPLPSPSPSPSEVQDIRNEDDLPESKEGSEFTPQQRVKLELAEEEERQKKKEMRAARKAKIMAKLEEARRERHEELHGTDEDSPNPK